MRKTYNAPEMNVMEIQTAGMLAQSSFDLNSSGDKVGGGAALSRESDGSFWDDDEDF